ncbi:hypothetical protein [Pelotalea chapellei]|uniref:Periplasmic heavy metal sensor n=1 Tax=Pelotalea chapellei TaxID=44671 RepID=A0ABS5U3T0_9BACT|nr:hypothetical protein [Pelotalea chapellei]MBT1070323.1 hypothetical protein [Pelotalea chapellei]
MSITKYTIAVAITMMMACSVFAADKMKGMQGHGMQGDKKDGAMQAMMSNPHHKLGMAYKKNLQNFAKALKSEVTATGKVDKDFAIIAVNEMRQSLKQMENHHKEMQDSMSPEMQERMTDLATMMDSRLNTTNQHLDLLEKEVKADNPDSEKIVAEVDQIMKQCEMMKMKGTNQKKK